VNQVVQGAGPLLSTNLATVQGCSPACGGAGTYTLTSDAPGYNAPQDYVFGNSQTYLAAVENGTAANVTFTQNYVDGDAINTPLALQAAGIELNVSGNVTITYNAFFRIQARPVELNTLAALNVQDNYWEAFGLNLASGHQEIIVEATPNTATTVPLIEYLDNTVLWTANVAPLNGTASIWATTGMPNPTIADTIAQYNTTVVNSNGGQILASAASVELNSSKYQNVTISQNYIDGRGAYDCFVATGGVVGKDSWLTNNYSMTTGNLQSTFAPCD
jgi:hypothetical protein